MNTLMEKAGDRVDTRAAAPLKVLIADDHPLMLLGVRRTLEASEEIEIAGEAHSAPELLALIERRQPDAVLMDLRMPGVQGDSCIAHIARTWPQIKVVVLSACDDSASIDAALAAGASAYAVKSVGAIDLVAVLTQTRCGSVYHAPSGGAAPTDPAHAPATPALTERETAILVAVARGLTTKSIGSELWISEHTVKFHLTNIYRKLGVSNRSSAIRFALEHDLA